MGLSIPLQWLNKNLTGVVFLLWGRYAQTKGARIDQVWPSGLSTTFFRFVHSFYGQGFFWKYSTMSVLKNFLLPLFFPSFVAPTPRVDVRTSVPALCPPLFRMPTFFENQRSATGRWERAHQLGQSLTSLTKKLSIPDHDQCDTANAFRLLFHAMGQPLIDWLIKWVQLTPAFDHSPVLNHSGLRAWTLTYFLSLSFCHFSLPSLLCHEQSFLFRPLSKTPRGCQ